MRRDCSVSAFTSILCFLFFCQNPAVHGQEASRWRVWINIPACTMIVYCNDAEWKRFPVAVGKPETPTPEGSFQIVEKVVNPTWFPPKRRPVPPGPRNPLGQYWLGLNIQGYGIHGNNNPESIGHYVTNGCIRLRNDDVAELFKILPKGTPVVISYDLVEIYKKSDDGRFYLRISPDVYCRCNDETAAIAQQIRKDVPDYPAYIQGLQWALGRERPAEVEIPRRAALKVDEEPWPDDGFVMEERLYLPGSILRLWGETAAGREEPFLDEERLGRESGALIARDGELQVRIRTIRVCLNGSAAKIRGRWQNEPLLDLAELSAAFKLKAEPGPVPGSVVCGDRLITDLPCWNGRLWIGVSRLILLVPDLIVHWDPEKRQVNVSLRPQHEGPGNPGPSAKDFSNPQLSPPQ